MPDFWQQLLLDLAISLLGGLIGGGIISTYLDWRRFRREEAEIKKEERRIEIDPIKSVISIKMWQVTDSMSDKLQLYIFKNNLQGSVQEYAIVAEFVLTNVTDSEVIVTRIEVEEPGLPPLDWFVTDEAHKIGMADPERYTGDYITPEDTGFLMYDMQAFYDWESKEETKVENVTLAPKATLKLAYVAVRRFCAIRRLSTPPKNVSVTVHSTGKHKVTEILELAEGPPARPPYQVAAYLPPRGSVEAVMAEQMRRNAAAKAEVVDTEDGEEIPF
jgi:hypothetical protein